MFSCCHGYKSGCINKVFRGLCSDVSIAFVQSRLCRCFFLFSVGGICSDPAHFMQTVTASVVALQTAGLAVNFSPRRISVVGIAPPWGISFSRSTQRGSESVSASLSFNCKQSLSHNPFHLVIPVGTRVSGKETWFAVCLIMPFAHGNVRIVFASHFGQVDLDGLKGSGFFFGVAFFVFLVCWGGELHLLSYALLLFPIHKISNIWGTIQWPLLPSLPCFLSLSLLPKHTHTQSHSKRSTSLTSPTAYVSWFIFTSPPPYDDVFATSGGIHYFLSNSEMKRTARGETDGEREREKSQEDWQSERKEDGEKEEN